jgi:hypothetical protein
MAIRYAGKIRNAVIIFNFNYTILLFCAQRSSVHIQLTAITHELLMEFYNPCSTFLVVSV